jgi:hypothetical protein
MSKELNFNTIKDHNKSSHLLETTSETITGVKPPINQSHPIISLA